MNRSWRPLTIPPIMKGSSNAVQYQEQREARRRVLEEWAVCLAGVGANSKDTDCYCSMAWASPDYTITRYRPISARGSGIKLLTCVAISSPADVFTAAKLGS